VKVHPVPMSVVALCPKKQLDAKHYTIPWFKYVLFGGRRHVDGACRCR